MKARIIIAVLLIIGLISFSLSPFFQIKNIEIEGQNILREAELREMTDKFHERNILLLNNELIESTLLKNQYINDCIIKKHYPDTIHLIVYEHKPLGKLINNGKYIVFNNNGDILEEGAMNLKVDVPLIKGVAYSFSQDRIIFPTEFAKIVQALALIKYDTIKKIDFIEYKSNTEIVMFLKEDIEVLIGKNKDIEKKFKVLSSSMANIMENNSEIEYIDLRVAGKPVIKVKN